MSATPVPPPAHHRQQRERFLAKLAETRTAAIIPTHTSKVRSNDSDFRFRPGSDFWWLTGFGEPDAWLVLLPEGPGGKGEGPRTVLFLRPRDRERETWDGRRLGVERAAETLGVDEARDVARLWLDLPELLVGYSRIVWRMGEEPERDRKVGELAVALRRRARGSVHTLRELVDPLATLHELRLFKSEDELRLMRKAAAVASDAHRRAMAFSAPGRFEHEVEALLDAHYRSHGCNGPAYGNIVAGGANACILHYVENDMALNQGELLLVDSGCEWRYYASDITRTWPIDGEFTADQRALYDVAHSALVAATKAAQPGARFDDVHEAAVSVLVDGLIALGIVKATRAEALEKGLYKPFYMHKTSHWLGLDVHDVGLYQDADGKPRTFEPGMVLTVEPGLYIPEDAEVDARWRGIGIRVEDDVAITATGNEVLTAACPCSAAEVEAACAAGE
ncbi:MAG: aminopeptidase P N-terminal domain-containing protein [Planctomycetota bacterium]